MQLVADSPVRADQADRPRLRVFSPDLIDEPAWAARQTDRASHRTTQPRRFPALLGCLALTVH